MEDFKSCDLGVLKILQLKLNHFSNLDVIFKYCNNLYIITKYFQNNSKCKYIFMLFSFYLNLQLKLQ